MAEETNEYSQKYPLFSFLFTIYYHDFLDRFYSPRRRVGSHME
ncbi:hypothetical protein HMPREF9374_1271 [Desmospora sp. 8437]|nr:hypothetical protein HMPREF9374_1271 [Desmospora sp. 8437]